MRFLAVSNISEWWTSLQFILTSSMQEHIKTVAVVGCGVIGASWASLFLSRGLNVIIFDPAEGAQEVFKKYLHGAWPALKACGTVEDAWAKNYNFVDNLESSLPEADFVQEVSTIYTIPQSSRPHAQREHRIAN